jgi:hypothetical protein
MIFRRSVERLTALAIVLALAASAPAAADPRAAVIELEWPTASGYERCAGVATARGPRGVVAWTAAHCTLAALSIVRFYDGSSVRGSAVRLLARAASADAAALLLPLSHARSAAFPLAVAGGAPPLGTTLSVIGHPVSALRAPAAGRWTVTYARMGETVPNPATGALEYEIFCGRCGPGNSGSGVFGPDGRLVGIVYGVTDIAGAAGGRLPDGRYALVVPAAGLR